MESKTKLLDQMRHVLRLKHMSIRTEKAYVQWAKRFILFHHKRHPADMGAPEIRAFLTYLAVEGQIAASTQNVALQALVFLYRHVLKQPFPELADLEHVKKSRRVPVVFARQEVTKVLAHLTTQYDRLGQLLAQFDPVDWETLCRHARRGAMPAREAARKSPGCGGAAAAAPVGGTRMKSGFVFPIGGVSHSVLAPFTTRLPAADCDSVSRSASPTR